MRVAVGSLPGVDLNLAVQLAALLQERNVTRAAERAAMSQPAMSAALSRLRGHFGDELLHRVGRHYELTALGAELLPVVRQALAAAEVALGHRAGFDPATSDRHFTVALSDYAITVLAEPLLAALGAGGMDDTPADRLLAELGVHRRVEVTVQGLLPLPLTVSGTDLCAFVPARLADRCRDSLSLVTAELPFTLPELVEAAHWHPSRSEDPALTWLRDLIIEIAA